MAFNNPTPQTEDLYIKSINLTVDQYRVFLEQVRTDTLALPNYDFDTGNETKAAEYALTDDAYAKLLDRYPATNSTRPQRNSGQHPALLLRSLGTHRDQVAHSQSVLSALDQLKSLSPVAFRLSRAARAVIPARLRSASSWLPLSLPWARPA